MYQIPKGNVGFIGLGAMGKPMVGHLAHKLPREKKIYVYDVVQSAIDDLCADYPDRVFSVGSPKEAAGKCVGAFCLR